MGQEYVGSISLASRGLFYSEDDFAKGVTEFPDKLTVTPWGAQEERILLSRSLGFRETLDRLIINCTNCPIPPGKLLLSDRQHLFYYMRCLSYGGAYEFPFQCDNCDQTSKHEIDLEKDLDVVYADDPKLLRELEVDALVEPFEFELPILGRSVSWRMLRGDDEKAVDKYVKKLRKKSASDGREDYEYRLALRIVAVDSEKVDIVEALDFVREDLKGKDLEEFRYQIERVGIGIDPEIEVTCKNCGFENEIIMPLDKSFFRPPRRKASYR
jgi:hypothetical protein